MSLTTGPSCPRTPLRRVPGREMSAGPKPLREDFRSRYAAGPVLLLGLLTESGLLLRQVDSELVEEPGGELTGSFLQCLVVGVRAQFGGGG